MGRASIPASHWVHRGTAVWMCGSPRDASRLHQSAAAGSAPSQGSPSSLSQVPAPHACLWPAHKEANTALNQVIAEEVSVSICNGSEELFCPNKFSNASSVLLLILGASFRQTLINFPPGMPGIVGPLACGGTSSCWAIT